MRIIYLNILHIYNLLQSGYETFPEEEREKEIIKLILKYKKYIICFQGVSSDLFQKIKATIDISANNEIYYFALNKTPLFVPLEQYKLINPAELICIIVPKTYNVVSKTVYLPKYHGYGALIINVDGLIIVNGKFSEIQEEFKMINENIKEKQKIIFGNLEIINAPKFSDETQFFTDNTVIINDNIINKSEVEVISVNPKITPNKINIVYYNE